MLVHVKYLLLYTFIVIISVLAQESYSTDFYCLSGSQLVNYLTANFEDSVLMCLKVQTIVLDC